jgi:hypothetical protein
MWQGLRRVAAFSPSSYLRRPGAGPILAFVHIPKTAGATVTSMFIAAYTEAAVGGAGNYFRHPDQTRATIARARWTGHWRGTQVVVGHVPYALFAKNLPSDTRYMTFLREPVDRVLSHYHRHIERKSPAAMSLEEALKQRMPEMNNLATRCLCDDPSPLGDLRPGAVEEAKANLRAFAFVGIQERFDESVVLLQRMLALDLVPYFNRHVSTDRPAIEDLSDEKRRLIRAYNRLDAELYDFALERFEEAAAAADDGFAPDVERVRGLSRDANEKEIQTAAEWLDRQLSAGTTWRRATLYEAAEAAGVPEPALKHVLARSSLEKVRDRDGQKVFRRPPAS